MPETVETKPVVLDQEQGIISGQNGETKVLADINFINEFLAGTLGTVGMANPEILAENTKIEPDGSVSFLNEYAGLRGIVYGGINEFIRGLSLDEAVLDEEQQFRVMEHSDGKEDAFPNSEVHSMADVLLAECVRKAKEAVAAVAPEVEKNEEPEYLKATVVRVTNQHVMVRVERRDGSSFKGAVEKENGRLKGVKSGDKLFVPIKYENVKKEGHHSPPVEAFLESELEEDS